MKLNTDVIGAVRTLCYYAFYVLALMGKAIVTKGNFMVWTLVIVACFVNPIFAAIIGFSVVCFLYYRLWVEPKEK